MKFITNNRIYSIFNKIYVKTLSNEALSSSKTHGRVNFSLTPPSKEYKLVRQEPGAIRLGFIPNEWFEFFFKRTGVTGLGTLSFNVGLTLASKEYYIMDHEFICGMSLILFCIIATKQIGPTVAKYLDEEITKYEKSLIDVINKNKKAIEDDITYENTMQKSMEAQLILMDAKRENVALQQEAAYRERLMMAYKETVKRLRYCAVREAAEKALAKRCMADWVIEQVRNAVSKKIEDDSIAQCIKDLKFLTEHYKKLESPYTQTNQQSDEIHFVPTIPKGDKKK